MMNSQRWSQIEELYYSALPLNQHERSKFIAQTCDGDTVLREEVNSLLQADESSGDFLERSIVQVGLQILVDSSLRSTEARSSPEKPIPDNLVGSTVDGRYEIVEKLGSGGVGDVYRARDAKVLFRTVVVKVLKDSSLSRPWIVGKFQQEIEALTKITDPGVVGIIDAGKLPEGKPYLVMEFVEGGNLREYIQRNHSDCGLPFDEIAEIVKQVGRTISSAHEAGIIHRDLKPANIMVRRNANGDLQVKVIDFGIAKITSSITASNTTTGLVAGTVYYMAPEQLQGQKAQPMSDVYALGVICYEMVAGARPFNPESIALLPELQRAGIKVPPRDLRPGLPLAAQEAIVKALSYHPADRYQRARDFGDALAQALMTDQTADSESAGRLPFPNSHEPAQGSLKMDAGPIVVSRPEIPSRRFKRLALSLVGILCLLLLGVSAYVWSPLSNTATERTLTYSLTVQKMRDGKPYQLPFSSSGQEIFESGYMFRLNVTSHQAGFFYVFNEGATDKGDSSLTIIYPTPRANNGSAKIDANQMLQSNWNEFQGGPGTEHFWMIWSASPVLELEAARAAAFTSGKGAVSDPGLGRKVREFLLQHSEPRLETRKDSAKRETVVKGTGDLMVMLLELEHQ